MSKYTTIGLFFCLAFVAVQSFGQARTTVQDGTWNDPATWGGFPPPDFNVGAINVDHNVTIDDPAYPALTPLVVDQLNVRATGTLTITSGAAIQIRNGGGNDLTVNATGLLTINSGAEFLINNGVVFSSTSATNTIFQPSSIVRTAAANLPTASGLDGIDIYIQDVVATLTLNATWSQLGANTNLYVNCLTLGANASINFAGFITALQKLEITNTNGSVGGRVIINSTGTSTLSVGSGGVNIQDDSRLWLTTTGTVTLNLVSDFIFNSNSTNVSQNATSGTGTINFNGGDFIMTSGLWSVAASGTGGDGFFNFNGPGSDMLVTGGLISENGGGAAQGTFAFNDGTGSQTLTWAPSAIGTGTMNLVVAKSTTNLDLTTDLVIAAVTLTSGTLVTEGSDLTISGAVNIGTGKIDATATTPSSTYLSISGAGTLPASIPFVSGSVLSNLLLNRTGTSLAITNVSIEDGGLVTVTAGSITSSLGAVGVYDILYNNTAALITGSEIPVSPTVLRNLTKTGGGAVTLASSPTINGDLTISAGSIAAGSNNVSLSGNFVNNAAFTQALGGTFTFLTNPHMLTGTNSATFGVLVINGDLTVSNVTCALLGNLDINSNSSLNATSGTVAFNVGPHSITNNGTSVQFNNVSIGNGASMTAPLNGTISIAGNFSGNGTFVNNGSTVIFNGTTTITGSVKTFYNITVATLSSFSGAIGFTVLSNLVNDGTINFTLGTLAWNSDGTFSGSSSAALNTITVSATRTLNLTLNADITLLQDLNLTGNVNHTTTNNITIGDDLLNNGNLTSLGTITFTGATAAMAGTGIKNLTNLVVSGTLTVTNNVPYTITDGSLNVSGTLTTTNGTGVVTIEGNTSVIGTGIETTFNFLLINGTLNATGTINLLRDFTNNGVFNAGTGTVTLSGVAIQNIQGSSTTTFNNINISNISSFVNVQSNQNLRGILTLAPGGARFDADGTASTSVFTLLSTSSIPVADGAIAAIPVDATFQGNVTIQRFMQNAGKVNRYISAPVSGMAASQLDFSKTNSSIRYYNEAVPGAIGLGYTTLPIASSFVNGRGYLAYMFYAVNLTWDATGAINQGSIQLPVSYTPSTSGPDVDGWNLVGNPYPSGIVWANGAGWNTTNIDPIISVPDLSITTGYPNYYHTSNFNDNSGDLPNDFIAMGQAFWVHANAASPALTVNESAKSPATGGNFYRKASSPSEQLIIAINNGKYEDRSFLKLNDNATEDYDARFDGYKLRNEEMNIYLIDHAQRSLVMHTLSEIPADMRIPLGVEVTTAGEYEITFANVDRFSASPDLFLIDSFEGQSIPVAAGKGYTFKIHDATQPVRNRFYLSRSTAIAEKKMADWLQAYPNPVKDELTIVIPSNETAKVSLFDSTGAMIWVDEIKGAGKVDLRNYAAGMFLLKVQHGNEVVVRKIMK